MTKTSSTSPCSAKISFRVSSSVPGGAPPMKSLFSGLGVATSAIRGPPRRSSGHGRS